MIDDWGQLLKATESADFAVFALDAAPSRLDRLAQVSNQPLPESVAAFIQHWNGHGNNTWQILSDIAQDQHRGTTINRAALQAFQEAVQSVVQAALVWDRAGRWHSPQRWGYLFELRSSKTAMRCPLLLHPPAQDEEIAEAESIMGFPLPPSYRDVLRLTNGFGRPVTELAYLCGAGPQRANWDTVLYGTWLDCETAHEVAAQWRWFYGIYNDESVSLDPGSRSLIDKKILAPIAYTYDMWCFDTSRPDKAGEYPIGIWDHETCTISFKHQNMEEWLAHEFIPYVFGLDEE